MSPKAERVRVQSTAALEPLQIAQALVGDGLLVKAEPVPRYGKRTFRRFKTMLTLTERFERAYEKQLDKIMVELRGYIEETIGVKLKKADDRTPLFTPAELFEMQQIVENYHQAFIAGTVGPETLPPGAVDRLVDAGILPSNLKHTFDPTGKETPPAAMAVIEDAYRYGHVLAAARTAQERSTAHKISYEQFSRKHAPKIPLGDNEKQALAWIKTSAAQEIKGLGNKVADDMTTLAIEADKELRRKYTGVIRDAASENVQRSETWRQLASDMGHKTGDWARDFKRIAATEKQKAMQEGQVQGLIERYGDPDDVRVAKQPNPDACPSCVKLHYTSGQGSPLRIFKLSDLIANGSNVGKKHPAWLATVGPVHPWCGCEIIQIPEGWGFDEDNNLVPESMLRSDWLSWDLRKAVDYGVPNLAYSAVVPEKGISIRVGDPEQRAAIEKVIAKTPPEIFHRDIGITFITTDIPRAQNPLDDHDFAYWSGNEIRISQMLKPELIPRVLPHEIGHSLNVFLIRKYGSIEKVRAWHDRLFKVSQDEGFVSAYAKREPIENAAEVTMEYLYRRPRLMLRWPRQFAFAHKEYRTIFEG